MCFKILIRQAIKPTITETDKMTHSAIIEQNRVITNNSDQLFDLLGTKRKTARIKAEIEIVREKLWTAEHDLSCIQEQITKAEIFARRDAA